MTRVPTVWIVAEGLALAPDDDGRRSDPERIFAHRACALTALLTDPARPRAAQALPVTAR